MFSNKKQSSTIFFTLFTILKTIHFFTSDQNDFGEQISSQSKSS